MDINVADQLAGQSPAAWLDAMGDVTRQRRLLEVNELEMLAGWAAINSTDDENDAAFITHGLKKHMGG